MWLEARVTAAGWIGSMQTVGLEQVTDSLAKLAFKDGTAK